MSRKYQIAVRMKINPLLFLPVLVWGDHPAHPHNFGEIKKVTAIKGSKETIEMTSTKTGKGKLTVYPCYGEFSWRAKKNMMGMEGLSDHEFEVILDSEHEVSFINAVTVIVTHTLFHSPPNRS